MPATKFFSIWKKYLGQEKLLAWDVYLRRTYKKGHSENEKNQEEIIWNENELLNYLFYYF